jgi:signal transduction histidine kinase
MQAREKGPSVWGIGGGGGVLALGLLLSFALSWTAHVVLRRTSLMRVAHEQALHEVRERRRAEAARERALERYAMLSRKVLLAQEDERSRLSRDLHDELGQILTAMRLELGWLKRQIEKGSEDGAALDGIVDAVDKGADELRRICRGLRPPLLDDLGIEPAVRQLVKEHEQHAGVQVETDLRLIDDRTAIPAEVALCAYRIIQEALTNADRHASAKHARVEASCDGDNLEVIVRDDGVGFDPDTLDVMQGLGLAGMRERANLVGGEFEIESAPGRGTQITFRAPLRERSEEVS